MTTIVTLHISSPVIRCTATHDIPEYGIRAEQDFFLRRIDNNLYEVIVEPDTEEIPVVVVAQPIEHTPATPVIAMPHKHQPLRTATRKTRTKSVEPTTTTSTHRHTLLAHQDSRSLEDKIFGSLKPYAYI